MIFFDYFGLVKAWVNLITKVIKPWISKSFLIKTEKLEYQIDWIKIEDFFLLKVNIWFSKLFYTFRA